MLQDRQQQQKLARLRSTIDQADLAYYRPGFTPIMSDADYDRLKSQLRQWAPDDIRLTRVGPPYSIEELRTKRKHSMPMGSLDNTDQGIIGLPVWYNRLVRKLDSEMIIGERFADRVLASHKVDGNSVAARYQEGVLVEVISRGDGVVGEDITANAVHFQGLPTVLPEPISAVVRGEAVLYRADFERINHGRPADEISNPRNTGNGIIGRSDGENCALMRFIAFSLHAPGDVSEMLGEEQAKFNRMAELGFNVVPHRLCATPEEVEAYYLETLQARHTLDYDIDGLVVVLNSLPAQLHLATDDRSRLRPKYARAVKFPEKMGESRVEGVIATIGHTGSIVPTARLARTRIGGIFNTKALLTNYNEAARLDVAVGDRVEVALMGDIIPKIIRVLERPAGRSPIVPPTHCPTCGSVTTREFRGKSGANCYCTNPECPGIMVAKIHHWVGNSKKGVGILGLGDKIELTLWEQEIVNDPADLYLLRPERIENVKINGKTRLGRSRAETICNNIQQKRDLPLHIFLGSLGVDLLGRRRVQLLQRGAAGKLDRLQDWLDDDKLATITIPGLGEETRQAIRMGLRQCRGLINRLLANGVTVQPATTVLEQDEVGETEGQSAEPAAGRFDGMNFVFTGTRDLLEEVKAEGGTVQDGVRKNTHYLVQKGDKLTSKAQKAQDQGVRVISLELLERVLAGEAELPPVLISST